MATASEQIDFIQSMQNKIFDIQNQIADLQRKKHDELNSGQVHASSYSKWGKSQHWDDFVRGKLRSAENIQKEIDSKSSKISEMKKKIDDYSLKQEQLFQDRIRNAAIQTFKDQTIQFDETREKAQDELKQARERLAIRASQIKSNFNSSQAILDSQKINLEKKTDQQLTNMKKLSAIIIGGVLLG